jgi:rod shape determining protein RodA
LISVAIMGHVGKGAQRWLHIGFIHFEPSEMMKLALPMMLAQTLHQQNLPPSKRTLSICLLITVLPVLLVAKQPDLGTAIMLMISSFLVLFLAGLPWGFIRTTIGIAMLSLPIQWKLLHTYQKQRVLTFLNPQRDPMGSGYHIIQSKIAIGSGGFWGKGWFDGTQSHLKFLPEHATDFIFSVCAEEFGFLGSTLLLSLALAIAIRLMQLGKTGQNTFSRLLACNLGIMFFISFLINMGMVTGLFPVVGLPLPLISYGGSSILTYLTGFGIVMSAYRYRHLLGSQHA